MISLSTILCAVVCMYFLCPVGAGAGGAVSEFRLHVGGVGSQLRIEGTPMDQFPLGLAGLVRLRMSQRVSDDVCRV